MLGSARGRGAGARRTLLVVNGAGAAAAAVAAAVGMARPGYVEADSSSDSLSESWGCVIGAAYVGHHRPAARQTRPQVRSHATPAHRRRAGRARRESSLGRVEVAG